MEEESFVETLEDPNASSPEKKPLSLYVGAVSEFPMALGIQGGLQLGERHASEHNESRNDTKHGHGPCRHYLKEPARPGF